jgi:hypothetical protein
MTPFQKIINQNYCCPKYFNFDFFSYSLLFLPNDHTSSNLRFPSSNTDKGHRGLFSSSPLTEGSRFLPPPSLRRMELRTGTNRKQCLKYNALWGSCHRCSILVPFHKLRANSGDLTRDPYAPKPLLNRCEPEYKSKRCQTSVNG